MRHYPIYAAAAGLLAALFLFAATACRAQSVAAQTQDYKLESGDTGGSEVWRYRIEGANTFSPIRQGSVIRVAPLGVRSLCNTSDEEMIYLCIQSKAHSLEEHTSSDGTRAAYDPAWKERRRGCPTDRTPSFLHDYTSSAPGNARLSEDRRPRTPSRRIRGQRQLVNVGPLSSASMRIGFERSTSPARMRFESSLTM